MNAELEMETRHTGFVTCIPVLYRDGKICYVSAQEMRTNPDPEAVGVVYEGHTGAAAQSWRWKARP